jgi:hypothetical protein
MHDACESFINTDFILLLGSQMKGNNGTVEISGHHLQTLMPTTLDRIRASGSVQIVDRYDDFCRNVCFPDGGGCEYGKTAMGEQTSAADRALAEHYGFEVGKVYTADEFMEIFGRKTEEQTREGSGIVADYFGLV